VFLYRVEGRRLVPRFLGSDLATLDIERLVAVAEFWGLEARDGARAVPPACRFDGFPLVCTATP
jgi:hypothetical protein